MEKSIFPIFSIFFPKTTIFPSLAALRRPTNRPEIGPILGEIKIGNLSRLIMDHDIFAGCQGGPEVGVIPG